jgi:hypothetical protein
MTSSVPLNKEDEYSTHVRRSACITCSINSEAWFGSQLDMCKLLPCGNACISRKNLPKTEACSDPLDPL